MVNIPDKASLPVHVAMIMDGNGRWAHEHGLPRIEGHRRGADVVRDITTFAREIGVQYLTLYSFSVQNWRRPPEEVAALMQLLEDYCQKELPTLMKNQIRLCTIGNLTRLPESTRQALQKTMQATAENDKMILTLAVDYGGREELLKAVRTIVEDVERGRMQLDDLDEASIAAALDTKRLPDPDFVIRTSGEQRVSNFLLWQIAYSELYFTEVFWPDFSRDDFSRALWAFKARQRRFGGVDTMIDNSNDGHTHNAIRDSGSC